MIPRIAMAVALVIGIHFHTMGQQASDYLPQLYSTWQIESTSTLNDSVVATSIRTDSLASIESIDDYLVHFIVTSLEGYTYKLDTRDDTLFTRVAQVLGSDFFDDEIIDLDIDPDDRLPIAIYSADVNDVWDVYSLEQTIELSDTLMALLPDNIDFLDTAKVEIDVSGIRLPEETISLPIGEITTQVFETQIDLTLTLYVFIFGFPVPVPLDLLEGYAIRTHTAIDRGFVKQLSEEYDVYATNENFNVNEYIMTIPANESIMIEFNEGDPTFVDSGERTSPYRFTLQQNYPNPFNPETTIEYTIHEISQVRLTVYDILGSRVITLVNGLYDAGSYTVIFDAANLPSGIYFYSLYAGGLTGTKRMVLSK